MTATHFLDFMCAFWMPLTFGQLSIIGAVLVVGFRETSDSPYTEWPREEW
jgi:hypothetical protein